MPSLKRRGSSHHTELITLTKTSYKVLSQQLIHISLPILKDFLHFLNLFHRNGFNFHSPILYDPFSLLKWPFPDNCPIFYTLILSPSIKQPNQTLNKGRINWNLLKTSFDQQLDLKINVKPDFGIGNSPEILTQTIQK